MSEARRRPFANGTQYGQWMYNNCERCPRWPDGDEWPACPLFDALADASLDDGTISAEVAAQIGVPDDVRVYLWHCPVKLELRSAGDE